jgi:cyclohexanecarboxylate-CoA ligase/acyl-CoA synthetase
MTETQGALYTRPGDALDVHCSSAGRPSPAPSADRRRRAAGAGCLLFPGFFDNDEANAAAFTARRLVPQPATSPAVDAAGNYSITGRVKDIINRGGVKFNPRDVEDLLDSHPKSPAVGDRADARPDPGRERPARLWSFAKRKTLCVWKSCSEYLLDKKIAKNKLPERLVIVTEMPLTPTRKVIKSRALLLALSLPA